MSSGFPLERGVQQRRSREGGIGKGEDEGEGGGFGDEPASVWGWDLASWLSL